MSLICVAARGVLFRLRLAPPDLPLNTLGSEDFAGLDTDAYKAIGQPDRAVSWQQRYLAPLLAADPATLNEAQTDLVAAIREDRRPGKK